MGILVPAILFGILFGVLSILVHSYPDMLVNNPKLYKTIIPKLILISLIPSLFILRHYLLNLKYDKTGRGIVVSTFVCGIIFVITQFAL
jgi:heme/copper-type cytochrome/quinol oxidase subunit 3